jgi:hypothetical protein
MLKNSPQIMEFRRNHDFPKFAGGEVPVRFERGRRHSLWFLALCPQKNSQRPEVTSSPKTKSAIFRNLGPGCGLPGPWLGLKMTFSRRHRDGHSRAIRWNRLRIQVALESSKLKICTFGSTVFWGRLCPRFSPLFGPVRGPSLRLNLVYPFGTTGIRRENVLYALGFWVGLLQIRPEFISGSCLGARISENFGAGGTSPPRRVGVSVPSLPVC